MMTFHFQDGKMLSNNDIFEKFPFLSVIYKT